MKKVSEIFFSVNLNNVSYLVWLEVFEFVASLVGWTTEAKRFGIGWCLAMSNAGRRNFLL